MIEQCEEARMGRIRSQFEFVDRIIMRVATMPIGDFDGHIEEIMDPRIEDVYARMAGDVLPNIKAARCIVLTAMMLRLDGPSDLRMKIKGTRSNRHEQLLAKIHKSMESMGLRALGRMPEASRGAQILQGFFERETREYRKLAGEIKRQRERQQAEPAKPVEMRSGLRSRLPRREGV